ncbi:ferritin-like domain-containing protein [Halorubellus sp. JP-L1]|uniref:ferritin-like domain-containing protein n=1 Tax=Halorubellus sp. JP-L1 TaxID=2715753 RepID=UPI0014098C48|nr:ferritin-like domain-containing protein [Halorubellus sp. JP-L1]NHN42169.1 ferritin-like domain-containing protein [Halorubellus sp. JP-L1]
MTDSNETTNDIAERIATSINDRLGDDDASRRGFLGRTALAGGGLLALGSGVGLTVADEHEDDDGMEAAFDDVEGTDLDVLNYALTLEHLEDALYQEATETFDESDYADSDALSGADEEAVADVVEYVQTAGEQEATHVDVLTQAVELLGGDPAQAGEYDFGIESADEFLQTAAVVENVGVSAYAGAAPHVESPDLLGVALSIHSVEARHAAVLNDVVGEPPFPNAFDAARSQQEVLDAAGPFITGGNMTDGNETDGNMTDGNATEGTTTTAGNETTTEDYS